MSIYVYIYIHLRDKDLTSGITNRVYKYLHLSANFLGRSCRTSKGLGLGAAEGLRFLVFVAA
jgi:hypothetical protein